MQSNHKIRQFGEYTVFYKNDKKDMFSRVLINNTDFVASVEYNCRLGTVSTTQRLRSDYVDPYLVDQKAAYTDDVRAYSAFIQILKTLAVPTEVREFVAQVLNTPAD